MKVRITNHTGNGSARHNFREFPEAAKGISVIDRSLSSRNKVYINGRWFRSLTDAENHICGIPEFVSQPMRFEDSRIEQMSVAERYELLVYEKFFKTTVANQNERNRKRRQISRNRTLIDLLASKPPEESILQIGNRENCPVTGDQLWNIYQDYVKKHNEMFRKNILIVSAVLHCDEPSGTPHIHQRVVYLGRNSSGELYPNKSSSYCALGIERPNLEKVKSRYNNRKQSYSKICRKIWAESCLMHGISVELKPAARADRRGLQLVEFKVSQEKCRLESVQDEVAQGTSRIKTLAAAISRSMALEKQLRDDVKEAEQELVDIRRQTEKAVADKQDVDGELEAVSRKLRSRKKELEDLQGQVEEMKGALDELQETWETDAAYVYECIHFRELVQSEESSYANSVIERLYENREFEEESLEL